MYKTSAQGGDLLPGLFAHPGIRRPRARNPKKSAADSLPIKKAMTWRRSSRTPSPAAGDYLKRPGMMNLLSFIDAQPNERFVIIFDDLKRASRDTRAYLDLRDAFRQRGVHMECLNMKLGDTPEDEFVETIMAAQGALERKQNGRQVAQKMKARMQSGYWNSQPACWLQIPDHQGAR